MVWKNFSPEASLKAARPLSSNSFPPAAGIMFSTHSIKALVESACDKPKA